MKNISILCFAPGTDGKAGEPLHITGPAVSADLQPLAEHYSKMGRVHAVKVQEFIKEWEAGLEEENYFPAALAVFMNRDTVSQRFRNLLPLDGESFDYAALVVWTVGATLEDNSAAMFKSDPATALLLDVAGSAALYDMHLALLEWVGRTAEDKYGLRFGGEVYPTGEDVSKELLSAIDSCLDLLLLGAAVVHGTMLKPRKTQYSFMKICRHGDEKDGGVVRCSPCSGRKCLYYQLGGCHMSFMKKDGEEPQKG